MTKRKAITCLVLILAVLGAAVLWARIVRERFQEALTESVTEALEMGLKKTRLQGFIPEDRVDLHKEAKRLLAEQSAQLILDHMYKAEVFKDRLEMLGFSLGMVEHQDGGLYCEFGVAGGQSINYLASKTKQIIHGFDSFEGLPEAWQAGIPKGAYRSPIPEVRANVRLHKGWFNESVPIWKKSHQGPVLFMHMDADIYSSTKTVFDILADRIVPGTVIQFDEYFNYGGWKDHEYKAFKEFAEANKVKFDYVAYNVEGQQVAVKILEIAGKSGSNLP